MGSRIAFVVNALAGHEVNSGRADASNIYRILTDEGLGQCDAARSPKPLDCSTRSEFENAFQEILGRLHTDDQLVLYFTGHGVHRGNNFCLLFGTPPDTNFLPFPNLINDLSVHFVSRALLVIDACFSGAAAEFHRKSLDGETVIHQPPRGIAIMASSRAVESSARFLDLSSSVFTHLLCEAVDTGLGGKPTETGFISPDDATAFIKQKLGTDRKYRQYQQVPVYGISGASDTIWISLNKSGRSRSEHVDAPSAILSDEQLRIEYELSLPSRLPCPGASVRDLSAELVEKYASRVLGAVTRRAGDLALAEQLGLLSHLNRTAPHIAAVLCFSDAPERFVPQARAIFTSGKTDSSEFMKDEVTGSLKAQIDRLVELTMGELRLQVSFGEDGAPTEERQIPVGVIREAISNALTHRNYQLPGVVRVRVSSDFIYITNPGAFPTYASWDDFLRSPGSSNPADPAIALYLSRQSAFEGIGRGFEVFKEFISKRGTDSFVWQEGPGPTVTVRIQRVDERAFNEALQEFEATAFPPPSY